MRELAWELVTGRLSQVRSRVSRRLPAPSWSQQDRDDAVSMASERILAALLRKAAGLAARSLVALVGKNVDWAVIELRRERARRWQREPPTESDDMPDLAFEPPPSPVEQAVAVGELLEAMSERERTVVYAHHVAELDFAEIAWLLDTSVPAVEKALTRGKRKAREARARQRAGEGASDRDGGPDRDGVDGGAAGKGSAPECP